MDKTAEQQWERNSTNLAFFSLKLVYKLNINNQKYQNSDHISAVYLFIKYSIAVWCCVLASRGYLEYILSFFLLLRFEQIMGGLFSYKVAKLVAIYPLLIHKSRDKEHSRYSWACKKGFITVLNIFK